MWLEEIKKAFMQELWQCVSHYIHYIGQEDPNFLRVKKLATYLIDNKIGSMAIV